MKDKQVRLSFPLRGKHEQAPAESVPAGFTLDCLNVVPADPALGRLAGGQRAGVNTAAGVTFLTNYEATFGVAHAGHVTALYRAPDVSGVQKLLVYYGSAPVQIIVGAGAALTSIYAVGVVPTFADPDVADINGIAYLAGVESGPYTVNLTPVGAFCTGAALTAAAGKGTVPANCALCCNFRGRLVLAGQVGSPQIVYMSRAFDPTDWDYGQLDALAALALNASARAGQVGAAVKALCPLSRDLMVIGADRQLYLVEGDPGAGGRVLTLSSNVGMLSRDAWCVDQDGALYFVGNGGGLYKYAYGAGIVNLAAGRMESFFRTVEANVVAGYNLSMVWDDYNKGCWVFCTKADGTAGKHLFYSAITDGFFPISLPSGVNPYSAVMWPGFTGVLTGGSTSWAYFDSTAATDSGGTTINSYAYLGPHHPITNREVTLNRTVAVMGQKATNWGCTFTAQSSDTAEEAYSTPFRSFTKTLAAGRNEFVNRLGGYAFAYKITGVAGKQWQVEHVDLTYQDAGIPRRK